MRDVYIVGTHSTTFGKKPEQTFKDLTRETYLGVLADREISFPLTRSMCAPIGDGAASALLCSSVALAGMSTAVQDRAVKLRASVLTGGYYKSIDEPSLSRVAADRAYEKAGLGPSDVDVVEVHDASSFSVVYQLEMLRLAPEGSGVIGLEEAACSVMLLEKP